MKKAKMKRFTLKRGRGMVERIEAFRSEEDLWMLGIRLLK